MIEIEPITRHERQRVGGLRILAEAMKAASGALLLGALAALASCQAERVLAFASPSDASGNAGTGGATPNDAGSTGGTTGTHTDAGGGWTPFGTPQVVTGLRSATDDLMDPSMTFEQLELYFDSPSNGQTDIWVSTRTVASDPWGPSSIVAELSSPQNDQDPEVSVDGLTMYMASDRGGSMQIYVSQRRTRVTAWGTPTIISLGTSTLDEAPGLDRTQLNLVFGSRRGAETNAHLYAATRPDTSAAWMNVTELSALNSNWEDTGPALFNNGSGLVFATRRLTSGGTSDLFQAARPDETSTFTSLAAVTELNTSANEEGPWMSQDGTMILFASDRSGHFQIYQASR
jgi:Tol biopolymer transport system component